MSIIFIHFHLGKGEPNSRFSHKVSFQTQQNCVLMESVLTIVYLVIMRENLRGWEADHMAFKDFF